MAIYTNTFEGGVAGTNITIANSGGDSGDAFGTVQPTTGTRWTYSNAAAITGTLGAERILDATSGYLRGDDPSPIGRGGLRRSFTVEALPTATIQIAQIRDASDTLMLNLSFRTSGRIRLAPAAVEVSASESPVLTVGQTYWIEVIVTPGATAATGRAELLITNLAGTTLHTYDTGFTVNLNTTNPPAYFRMGGFSTSSGWTVDRMDELRWGGISSGWIGELVDGEPTVNVTTGKYYVADYRASTPGTPGNTLTYSIAYVSGVNNLGSIVEPMDGIFHIPMNDSSTSVYRVTVSENGVTATHDVTVPVAGSTPPTPETIQRMYYDGTSWT